MWAYCSPLLPCGAQDEQTRHGGDSIPPLVPQWPWICLSRTLSCTPFSGSLSWASAVHGIPKCSQPCILLRWRISPSDILWVLHSLCASSSPSQVSHLPYSFPAITFPLLFHSLYLPLVSGCLYLIHFLTNGFMEQMSIWHLLWAITPVGPGDIVESLYITGKTVFDL